MGLYVEVMCDVMAEDRPDSIRATCWTNAGNNPQGGSIGTARDEAKLRGWKRVGGRDICPGCSKSSAAPNTDRTT